MRLRYFGPRNLTSDAIYQSAQRRCSMRRSVIKSSKNGAISAQLLNLLNRHDHDIDYAYIYRITPTAAAAFGDVFHPVEPFQVRFTLVRTFGNK